MKLRKSPESHQPQDTPKLETLNHGEVRRLDRPMVDADTVRQQLGFSGFELMGVAKVPVSKHEKVGHDGKPFSTETSRDLFIFRATDITPKLDRNFDNYPSTWATSISRKNEVTIIDGDSLSRLVDVGKLPKDEFEDGYAASRRGLSVEEVRPGDSITIGRGDNAAFNGILDADRPFASREHLQLSVDEMGAIQLQDTSSNGTELTSMQ